VMDILNAWMDLIDPSKLVNEVVIILISGIVGLITGILYSKYKLKKAEESKKRDKFEQEQNKEVESKNEKRILTGKLLSEIHRNQKLLKPFNLSDNNKLPNELKFHRSIYSELSDKIVLPDDVIMEIIDEYYPKLNYIENEYKKLELIHGETDVRTFLLRRQLEESRQTTMSIPSSEVIEYFFKVTNEANNIGIELIKYLEDI